MWGWCVFVFSQEKEIDTVFILNKRLEESRLSQEVINLSDEAKYNTANLSELLRFQTPFYIKENGRGMVASPAFRGGTAQQTAFVWNGININSIFLGQGDINNLGLLNFDNISVKTGGGSIAYGSGAIGGSVHLDDKVLFNKGLKGEFFSEYGSFNTLNSSLKWSYGNPHFFVKLNTSLSKSDNEYEVPEKQYINRNGKYYLYNYALSAGYLFSNRQRISVFSLWNTALQHYPVFYDNQTKTKYATNGVKTLLNWESRYGNFYNDLKLAFLREGYDYYSDIHGRKSNGAIGDTWLAKNDFSYKKEKDFSLNFITEYQYNEATGYASGIKNPKRYSGNVSFLAKKNLSRIISAEMAVRKEFVEGIKSPWLYSFGAKIDAAKNYSIKINGSKNFRIPTFNDRYWQPGGNLDLQPESAYQLEMGHHFKSQNFYLSFVPYYHHIENLIQWKPTSAGYWSPFNTKSVRSFGAEIYTGIAFQIRQSHLKSGVSYAYTHSVNLENKQSLPYIPKHKITANISLKNKIMEAYIQGIFTGEVYTTEDENKNYRLPSYLVVNTGAGIHIMKHLLLGIKIANLFDEVYETSSYYPLPLRNYSVYCNINF